MNYQEINIRGTRMCKVQFCEIEDYLIEKGIDANEAFDIMADEREFCYISNGFRVGLLNDVDFISKGEWHHYFVKQEDGSFSAKKLSFVNNK